MLNPWSQFSKLSVCWNKPGVVEQAYDPSTREYGEDPVSKHRMISKILLP